MEIILNDYKYRTFKQDGFTNIQCLSGRRPWLDLGKLLEPYEACILNTRCNTGSVQTIDGKTYYASRSGYISYCDKWIVHQLKYRARYDSDMVSELYNLINTPIGIMYVVGSLSRPDECKHAILDMDGKYYCLTNGKLICQIIKIITDNDMILDKKRIIKNINSIIMEELYATR